VTSFLTPDTFTAFCDLALRRRPQAWRWGWAAPYRTRFLRQLVVGAGLFDPARHAPTPLWEEWLAQTPAAQRATLAQAWVAQGDPPVREAIWLACQAQAAGSLAPLADFTGRVAAERQQKLWLPLAWLEYVEPLPDWDAPTHLRFLPPLPTPGHAALWQVDEGGVWVPMPYDWAAVWGLEQIAHWEQMPTPTTTRRYIFRPAQWQRAVAAGWTAAHASTLLEQHSAAPLPAGVLARFAPAVPDFTARAGVLLTFPQGAALDDLCQRPGLKKRLLERLSPQHVWVSAAQAPLFVRAFHRHGLFGITSGLLPASTSPHSGNGTRERANSVAPLDLLHLLLAAEVMQTLARDLDLPTPFSQSTLQELRQRLTPAFQRRLERAARLQLERLRQRLPDFRALLPNAIPTPQPGPDVAKVLRTAIQTGRAVQLHYQPPPPRPLITRTVIPLRVEPWGPHTYLFAQDLARDDIGPSSCLRTFRLDRIVNVAAL
jgi:hypothetical protein